MTPVIEVISCIEENMETCKGEVEYRESLSGTGTSIARCDYHWDKRLDKQIDHDREYPDSPTPPAWFDPSYAGETWDEE